VFKRMYFDIEQGRAHAALAAAGRDMGAVWDDVFYRPADDGSTDVDEDLYNGFIGKEDRRLLETLRKESPAKLAAASPSFDDPRLLELLFRYRARNFPETLNEGEMEHWEQHRAARFYEGAGGARSIDQFFGEIDHLQQTADQRAEQILGELYDYVELIAPAH
jgi:exodeoxyribonuclease-1